MEELFATLTHKVFTDGGLATGLLFVALIATNYYHIKAHRDTFEQVREDLANAWASIWRISETTNRALTEINGTLLVLKDRAERDRL